MDNNLPNSVQTVSSWSTKKNERYLQGIKQLVDVTRNMSPELKLAVKLSVNQLIDDIRERNITAFKDMVDYIKERAQKAIENNDRLTSAQKMNGKALAYILAELIKKAQSEKKPFWPGVKHGRIVRR